MCLFVCVYFICPTCLAILIGTMFFSFLQGQWKICIFPGCGVVIFCLLPPIVYTMFPFKSIPRACTEWGWHCSKKHLPKLYVVHFDSRKVILATFVICKDSYLRLSLTCSEFFVELCIFDLLHLEIGRKKSNIRQVPPFSANFPFFQQFPLFSGGGGGERGEIRFSATSPPFSATSPLFSAISPVFRQLPPPPDRIWRKTQDKWGCIVFLLES